MTIQIGERKIGPGHPCFVIAEIGNNHNGSIDKALELVDLAVEMGADCAKFQMRHLDQVYRKKSLEKSGDDLSAEYTIDLLKRFELSLEEHKRVAAYCEEKGILYMCTPWDTHSLAVLEEIGVKAYKVASADLMNWPLIEALIETKKPLILSTGMSSSDEIKKTVEFLNSKSAQFAILHCNSTYPAPFQNIHLNFMKKLKEIHPIIGYSGHERGIAVSLAAVTLGAQVLERHFTFDRQMEGPDHAASLEPQDFQALMEGVRQVEQAMGDEGDKSLSQGEMMNRENLAKSLVAARPLKAGTVLVREDIDIRSPGRGLAPHHLKELVGRKLDHDMEEEEFFYPTDLGIERAKARDYKFRRPWGVPIRYYDFKEFHEMSKPDLFEFHFSYSDMDLDPADYLKGTYDFDFVVHAPELFEGSHLMDLATDDDDYRNQSIRETQRIIDITRDLKKYFPKTERPQIIANVGGFSMDAPFDEDKKKRLYDRFLKSLKELNMDGVELIPQTMAPFPWHFGGQRYQNIFVLPGETAEICKANDLRICFDLSHSKLTANHFGIDFSEFVRELGPVTAHLHLADSKGVDGEGLQFGEGDIDIAQMAKDLDETAPGASFIPEIWQGHKNQGEGFWTALDVLERYL